MKTVPIDRLREAFAYDSETGVLTWKIRTSNRAAVGAIAGCVAGDSRVLLSLDGKRIRAHRVAWAMHCGHWPVGVIDHIDGNASNNKIANLRDIPQAGNMQNLKRARSDSQSGLLGAQRDNTRWTANIMVNGVKHYLGSFGTPQEAHAVYVKAKRELHPFGTL